MASSPNIDFGRPFTFVFEDQDWVKKLLMGSLYALLIFACYLGLFVLLGYQKRIIQATADGRDTPMPEFDRFGEDFIEGLKVFLVILGYIGPGMFIYLCGGFMGGFVGGATHNDDAGTVITMGAMCLAMPLFFVGNFLIPVGVIRFADTNSVGAAFQVGEVIAFVKENFLNVLLAFVVGIAAQMIAQFSILIFCVGIFAGMAWSTFVLGNVYGQVLKIARQKRGSAA